MIDKEYWSKIAIQWKSSDDGVGEIPKINAGIVSQINPDEDSFADISDDEIDDILADLDLDV